MITTNKRSDMHDYTMADIALNFPQAIRILDRYNLDYCCQGKMKFTTACERLGLKADKVWEEILDELPIPDFNKRTFFNSWEAKTLMDFIKQNHHEYLRLAIPQIKDLLNTIQSVHGSDLPEIGEIQSNFELLSEELFAHISKEEEVIFPVIKRITSSPVSLENETLIKNLIHTIGVMQHEHERAGDLLRLIRTLSNRYTPPAYACPTFQLAYKLLEEFDHDVVQHIHLENNVLFEKIKEHQSAF